MYSFFSPPTFHKFRILEYFIVLQLHYYERKQILVTIYIHKAHSIDKNKFTLSIIKVYPQQNKT